MHKVRAHGGCFTWHSSSSHIVNVLNDVNIAKSKGLQTCVSKSGDVGLLETYVSVVHDHSLTYHERQNSWVYAEDLNSGKRAEIEVYVDKIDHIMISTSTRRINIGDIEALEVLAFDEHGNVFSNVEGIPFIWNNDAEHTARPVSFAEANMNISSSILALDLLQQQSSILPIQGIAPGKIQIQVQLACEKGISNITGSVVMLVSEPVDIFPTLLRICVGTGNHFDALARKSKLSNEDARVRKIAMPHKNYVWHENNNKLVHIDTKTGAVEALALGHTQITLENQNLQEVVARADVVVVDPVKVHIVLFRNKAGVEKISYDKTTNISDVGVDQSTLDKYKQDLSPLPRCNGVYHLKATEEYVARVFILDHMNRVVDSCGDVQVTVDGGQLVGKKDQFGNFLLSGKNKGNGKLSVYVNEDVQASVDIHVLENMLVAPIVLPTRANRVDTNLPLTQQCGYPTVMEGGSGRFFVNTNSMELDAAVTVTNNVVQIYTLSDTFSQGVLHIYDTCQPDISQQVKVTLVQPKQVCYLPTSNELLVQEVKTMQVAVHGADGSEYTNLACLKGQVDTTVGLSVIGSMNDIPAVACDSMNGKYCYQYSIKGHTIGYYENTFSLKGYKEPSITDEQHEAAVQHAKVSTNPSPYFRSAASIVVSVYKPLHTKYSNITMGKDTQLEVEYLDGPLAWPEHGFETRKGVFHFCQARPNSPYTAIPITRKNTIVLPASPATLLLEGEEEANVAIPPLHAKIALPSQSSSLSVSQGNVSSLRFVCLDSAKDWVDVKIKLGNTPKETLPLPIEASTVVSIKCTVILCSNVRQMSLSVGSSQVLDLAQLLNNHPMVKDVVLKSVDETIIKVENNILTGMSLGTTLVHVSIPHEARAMLPWGVDSVSDVIVVSVVYDDFSITGPSVGYEKHSLVFSLGNRIEDQNRQMTLVNTRVNWMSEDKEVLITPIYGALHDHNVPHSNHVHVASEGHSVRIHASLPGVYVVKASIHVQYNPPSEHTISTLLQGMTKSHCPAHQALQVHGKVIGHYVEKKITIESSLQLITPSVLYLAPGSMVEIMTSLDRNTRFQLRYTTNTELLTLAKGSLAVSTSAKPNTSYNIVIEALNEAQEVVQSVTVLVHINYPGYIDAQVVTSLADPARALVKQQLQGEVSNAAMYTFCMGSENSVTLRKLLEGNAELLSRTADATFTYDKEPQDITNHNYLPKPDVPLQNATFDVKLFDTFSRPFDSVLFKERTGSLVLSVDKPHLLDVSVLALSPQFLLSSKRNTNSTATTLGSNTLAQLQVKAISTPAKKELVTITIQASTPKWAVAPIYLQVAVGNAQLCSSPYETPLGARIVVPLVEQSLVNILNIKEQVLQTKQRSSYIDMLMNNFKNVLQLTVKELVHGHPNMYVPALHVYLRSIDVTTKHALIDIVPVYTASKYKGDSEYITHPSTWNLREATPEANDITLGHVIQALHARFNIILPSRPLSGAAKDVVDTTTYAPNVALKTNIPTYPYATVEDATAALMIHFTQPLYTRMHQYPKLSGLLAKDVVLQGNNHRSNNGQIQINTDKVLWYSNIYETNIAIYCMKQLISLQYGIGETGVCVDYLKTLDDTSIVLWSSTLQKKLAAENNTIVNTPVTSTKTLLPENVSSNGDYSMLHVFLTCAVLIGTFIFIQNAWPKNQDKKAASPVQPIKPYVTAQPLFFDYDSQREQTF